MIDTGCALESPAMRSSEAATGTQTTMPACSISTTIGPTTTTTMSASADPTLQRLDAGHAATEGSILVESIPQETAKARQQAKPKTAAAPMGAVVESGNATLYLGDCLEIMPSIADESIDLILADLPYGTTACKWDSVIDLDSLWANFKRIIKPNAAIVLTAAQPFTTQLISSNIKHFKYEWIYEKTNPKGFLNASKRPLTAHENIVVFSYGKPPYFPQKWSIPEHLRTKRKHATSKTAGEVYGGKSLLRWDDDGSRFPTSVIGFSNRVGRNENFHPTQKPIELMEYLIKTYSLEGDMILDCTMGSCTTGIAAIRNLRKFIGIDNNELYFNKAVKRLKNDNQTRSLI